MGFSPRAEREERSTATAAPGCKAGCGLNGTIPRARLARHKMHPADQGPRARDTGSMMPGDRHARAHRQSMIGRHRRAQPPIEVAKSAARTARRDGKIANMVQRSVRRARIREHPSGGGTLLTEPVLVFFGKPPQDLRVFDQQSTLLGAAHRFHDKAAKLNGYEIYGADDEAPLLVINWPARWGLRVTGVGGSVRVDYVVSDAEGVEIATLTGGFRDSSALPVVVGGEKVGYLSPTGRSSETPWHVEDNQTREVACITHIGPARCHIVEIDPSLSGALRAVAVVASIICKEKAPDSRGGGGV
jgi:hypothetical protein